MTDEPELIAKRGTRSDSEHAEEELATAERVWRIYELQAQVGETPMHRIRETAAFTKFGAQRVRRYLALHHAPEGIKDLYRQGKLTSRTVDHLQALGAPDQLIMARRLLGKSQLGATMQLSEDYGLIRATKVWTGDATKFETVLRFTVEQLDEYLDASPRVLRETFTGAGGALGRRSIVGLITQQIELLEALRDTLENIKAEDAVTGEIANDGSSLGTAKSA